MPAALVIAGEGPNTFYDYPHGRVVKYDIEKLRSKVNKLNYRLRTEMFISENELYGELGWPTVQDGNQKGWNVGSGEIELNVDWVSDEDGKPVGHLSYRTEPRINYGDM